MKVHEIGDIFTNGMWLQDINTIMLRQEKRRKKMKWTWLLNLYKQNEFVTSLMISWGGFFLLFSFSLFIILLPHFSLAFYSVIKKA